MNKTLLLLFLTILSSILKAQEQNEPLFLLDTVLIVPIAIADISERYSKNNEIQTINDEYIYKVLNFDIEKGKISVLKLNYNSGVFNVQFYYFLGEVAVDYRSEISSIQVFKDYVFLQTTNCILVFEKDGKFVRQIEKPSKWNLTDVLDSNRYFLSFYYNFHPMTSLEKCGMALMDSSGKIINEIYPDADFYQLTHFKPNKLIARKGDKILLASVSEPVIHIYDESFHKLYSYSIPDKNWLSATELTKQKKYKKKLKKGVFEFAADELMSGRLSKSLSISFINDSTIYYSYCNGFSEVHDLVLKMEHNKLTLLKSHVYDSLDYDQWPRNNPDIEIPNSKVQFLLQNQKGLISDNRLFYFKVGTEIPLMNVTYNNYRASESSNILNTDTTYLQLYIFSYSNR